MKLRKKAFASFACSLALIGNSFGVLAQDKGSAQPQSNKKVTVRSADGQTKEFTVEGDGSVVVDQNGQQVRVFNRTTQEAGERIRVAPAIGAGNGGATFFSQDGTILSPPTQDFVFTRAQAGQGPDMTYSFVSSEMSFDNRLVKGAPFSADIENETVQTLADGNRIVRKSGGSIHRDGEGRTRRENTINSVGPFSSGESLHTVTINDTVTGSTYMLEPQNRTARLISARRTPGTPVLTVGAPTNGEAPKKVNVSGGVLQGNALKKVQPSYPPVAKAAAADGAVQVQIAVSEDGKVTDATVVSGHPLLRESAIEAAKQWEFKPTELQGKPVKVQGTLTFNFTLANKSKTEADSEKTLVMESKMRQPMMFKSNEESLGKQSFEGVEAEGKRITTTIPVGAIGNERAIEIVSESWYSPELKTVLFSRNSDPRTGETIYRLVNLRRAEPDASLFQVPSDYTVKEGGFSSTTGTFNYRVKPDNQ